MNELDLPNIFICGPSGSGKSTSLRNLDPDTSIIINTEGKRLPFRRKFPKQTSPKNWNDFLSHLDRALQSSANVIVIDSFTAAVEMLYQHCVRYETSDTWASWGAYKNEITDFLNSIKVPEKIVVLTGIEDSIQDDQMRIVKTIDVQGKWKGKVESQFEMVLWTQSDAEGNHTFLTNSDGRCSAKSPVDMLERVMPNDINEVINLVNSYYEEQVA